MIASDGAYADSTRQRRDTHDRQAPSRAFSITFARENDVLPRDFVGLRSRGRLRHHHLRSRDTTTAQGHPRSTGTFPRVLGHYVREKKLLSLTEAIRKMTSFPADFVGLRSRGRLAEGSPADITIFDPETIIDRSTYEEPNLMPEGVVHVFVNGVAVLQDGELTGEAPGIFLPREMRR